MVDTEVPDAIWKRLFHIYSQSAEFIVRPGSPDVLKSWATFSRIAGGCICVTFGKEHLRPTATFFREMQMINLANMQPIPYWQRRMCTEHSVVSKRFQPFCENIDPRVNDEFSSLLSVIQEKYDFAPRFKRALSLYPGANLRLVISRIRAITGDREPVGQVVERLAHEYFVEEAIRTGVAMKQQPVTAREFGARSLSAGSRNFDVAISALIGSIRTALQNPEFFTQSHARMVAMHLADCAPSSFKTNGAAFMLFHSPPARWPIDGADSLSHVCAFATLLIYYQLLGAVVGPGWSPVDANEPGSNAQRYFLETWTRIVVTPVAHKKLDEESKRYLEIVRSPSWMPVP